MFTIVECLCSYILFPNFLDTLYVTGRRNVQNIKIHGQIVFTCYAFNDYIVFSLSNDNNYNLCANHT